MRAGNLLIIALPVLLIGFMFLTQRRRQQAVQTLQNSLSVGDEVCTTSGLFGRIISLEGAVATLEVSPGVRVRFDRRAIGLKVDPTPAGLPATPTADSGE